MLDVLLGKKESDNLCVYVYVPQESYNLGRRTQNETTSNQTVDIFYINFHSFYLSIFTFDFGVYLHAYFFCICDFHFLNLLAYRGTCAVGN